MGADAQQSLESLAVFPLNVVLFPGGLLPLRIFEPRYLRMVSECLKQDAPFVVATIVDGTADTGGVSMTASVATLARIVDWEQGDDGLLELVCEGEQRCRIYDVEVEPDQLLRGMVARLRENMPRPVPRDLAWTEQLLREVLEKLGKPYDRLIHGAPSADHVAGRLVELLPLPLHEKRALFDMDDSVERLRRLAGLLQPDHDETNG
jgi:Lon protease-like protein